MKYTDSEDIEKFRITITVPKKCPRGTAVLFALSEVLKDIPSIAMMEQGERYLANSLMDQGDVWISGAWLKVAKKND